MNNNGFRNSGSTEQRSGNENNNSNTGGRR
jgi:hypothetical protein